MKCFICETTNFKRFNSYKKVDSDTIEHIKQYFLSPLRVEFNEESKICNTCKKIHENYLQEIEGTLPISTYYRNPVCFIHNVSLSKNYL